MKLWHFLKKNINYTKSQITLAQHTSYAFLRTPIEIEDLAVNAEFASSYVLLCDQVHCTVEVTGLIAAI